MDPHKIPRIVITPGEPAGIGPDIVINLAQKRWPAELLVVADPTLLKDRAKQLNLNLDLSTIKVFPIKLHSPVIAGQLNPANASYVMSCLETATELCLTHKADALVTGPIHKAIMNEANIPFSGHTEFLAERCKAAQAIMLFVTPLMKVALATTHLPLAQVPKKLTQAKLVKLIRLLSTELTQKFNLRSPRILVCGLNPHAGEQGHLGREEIEIIEPAVKQLQQENFSVVGPLPADTVFTEKYLRTADVIVAMYHDQALPVVKFQGFSQAVNVTLGLPIIRTSVDHGTALDLAGTGQADSGSLESAINLAIELCFAHS